MTDPLAPLDAAGRAAFGDGWSPTRLATAPGRLELLGNHVDYNGGLVLAGAIDRVIRAASGPDEDPGTIRLVAPDVSPDVATVPAAGGTDAIERADGPARYLAGIVEALREAGRPVRGGQAIAVSGDVPVGFGMSSSAALCVSLTMLLSEDDLDGREIVAIARRAEHLTGAPVGAMDQSASVAGGVILFDGASGGFERMDPDLGDLVFAVANSGVHHALSESAYPQRVEESAQALRRINAHANREIAHLGDIGPETWATLRAGSESWLDATLRRRVDHVVSELARVREGVDAIAQRDWVRFGALMTASGRSSAVDYEISHPAVEELVATLASQPGVLGARMMGGGEGGPALALLHRDAVPEVAAALDREFFARRGMRAEEAFEVCAFGPGARLEPIAPR